MSRRYDSLTILGKSETTYGVDATPTAGLNALELTEVTFTPLEREQVPNDYYRTYAGHLGMKWGPRWARIEGSADLIGSGVAGTPPAWGFLLLCCSMSEAITAAEKVIYTPATDWDGPSATLYVVRDGKKYVLTGVRGTWTIEMASAKRAKIKFSLTGLERELPADVTHPVPVLTAFKSSLVYSSASVPVFTLGASTVFAENFSLDLGNTVSKDAKLNREMAVIEDRKATGRLVIESGSVAEAPWDAAAADDAARLALALQLGAAEGSIVKIRVPALQLGDPGEQATRGRVHDVLSFFATPIVGNDEIEIEFA